MLVTDRERIRGSIREIVARIGRDRSCLIPILQAVQEARQRLGGSGHVDGYAMQVIADELGIHPVEVHSVVSFYTFLHGAPRGRFVVRLCRTLSCEMAGRDAVARQLENDLGVRFGETTPDGRFTLEHTDCLGLCDQGPALLVNDRVYSQVTPESVHEILEECRRELGEFAVDLDEEPR